MAELIPIDVRWPGAWEELKEYFDEALERSGASKSWAVEDLRQLALSGALQLWGVVHEGKLIGAASTQEIRYPQRRVLEIPFCAANSNTEEFWIPIYKDLREKAKQAGFAALVGGGRPGWARKLGGRTVYRCEFDLTGDE